MPFKIVLINKRSLQLSLFSIINSIQGQPDFLNSINLWLEIILTPRQLLIGNISKRKKISLSAQGSEDLASTIIPNGTFSN